MKKYVIILSSLMLFSCGGSEEDSPSSTPDPVNTAPTIPVQVYPTDNLLCVDNPLDFSWNGSTDSENDNISYEIQVATNNTFTSGVQTRTIAQTSTTFSLQTGVAYYWRIRAKDNRGEISDYSPINRFYTEGEGISNHLPFLPTLVTPLLNSTLTESSAVLSWEASDVDNDPLVYDVYFGINNPPELVASDVDKNEYEVNLNSNTIYYWKIVVKDDNGGQAIGQIWSFQKEQDPNAAIADNVVAISQENATIVSTESELNSGIYKIQFNQSPPEIEVDDIIFGDEGLGYLRRVSSVSVSNNIVTMETTQGNLEDVFGNVNINFSTDLSDFNKSSHAIKKRVNYERFAEGVSMNADGFIKDLSGVELLDGLGGATFGITEGLIEFDPNFTFDMDYSFFSIDRFEMGTQNARLYANANFELNTTSEFSFPLTEKSLYQNSITYAVLVPPIPVPVLVTVVLDVKIDYALNIGGTTSVSQRFESLNSLSLGAVYENDNWLVTNTFETNFETHPLEVSEYFTISNSLTFTPEVTVAIMAVTVAELRPEISLNAGLNVASASEDWDAFVNRRHDIKFGIPFGILGYEIIDFPLVSIEIFQEPVWNAPESVEEVSGNNQTGDYGEELAEPIKVRVFDSTGEVYLKDVPVYFSVFDGGGSVSSEMVKTDVDGYAEVYWTLGVQGEQTVEVTVKKADGSIIENAPIYFTADPGDTTPPVITLIGDSTINLNEGDTYTELGATATDDIDGDISTNIVIGGDTVDTNINNSATYLVTYNVSDANGNAATEVIRTVNVIANEDQDLLSWLLLKTRYMPFDSQDNCNLSYSDDRCSGVSSGSNIDQCAFLPNNALDFGRSFDFMEDGTFNYQGLSADELNSFDELSYQINGNTLTMQMNGTYQNIHSNQVTTHSRIFEGTKDPSQEHIILNTEVTVESTSAVEGCEKETLVYYSYTTQTIILN